jgi:hypothetical protein
MCGKRRIGPVVVFAAIIIGGLLSCDNPFEQGLGAKVNITPPEIRVVRPAVGDVIKGSAAKIYGEAVDDRKVMKIEAAIYQSLGDDSPPDTSWTTEGIEYDGTKNWTYTIDTTAITTAEVDPQTDGTIKIRFRVFDDGSSPVSTAPLAYIVKNNPPKISVTTPEKDMTAIVTGEYIRGSAEDAQGVKPGYPMIQIWPVTAYPADPPAGDDPDWGWVSTRIPGFTANTLDELKNAKTTPQFEFRLNEFTINAARQAVFTERPLPPGNYRFRLKVKDYALERTESGDAVENEDAEKERYYPDDPNEWRDIELAESLEAVKIRLDPEVTDPWTRMANSTEYKIVSGGDPDRILFVFRVRAAHTQGVRGAILRWKRDGDDALQVQPWDNGSENSGSLADPYFENGTAVDGDNTGAGKWFTFTAKGSHASLFRSSSVPYILYVEAKSYAGIVSTEQFSVYMDGIGPRIEINSVKGASSEPASAGGEYNVNGNIEVGVTIVDDETGIRMREDNPQVPETAWKIIPEAEKGAFDALITGYRAQPTEARRESIFSGAEPIQGASFKAATGDDGDYWLYILALDKARNLGVNTPAAGVLGQKLTVAQDKDKPVISLPGIDAGIDSVATLGVAVDTNGVKTGNTERKNIIVAGQDIEIALSDDDGLDLGSGSRASGVELYITDELGAYGRQQVPGDVVKAIFAPGGTTPVREKAAVLRMADLAQGLYQDIPADSRPAALLDGVYKLEITVSDYAGDKVRIDADVAAAESGESFWFAVSTAPPVIEVTAPAENALQNNTPVPVYGTVTSRLQVQRLWGSVVNSSTGVPLPDLSKQELVLYADAGMTNPNLPDVQPVDGVYTYYWKLEDNGGEINFDKDGAAGVKAIELEAAGRFANTGARSCAQIVDKGLPEVNLLAFEGMVTGSTDVNGVIGFTVTADDDYGLAGVKWWLLPAGDTLSGYGASFPTGTAGTGGEFTMGQAYTATVDTTALTNGGNYVLYVIAQDQAGNVSGNPLLQAIHVDQDTDKPKVGAGISPAGANSVAAPSTAVIAGDVSDDDGFSVPAGFVEVRFPAVAAMSDSDKYSTDDDNPSWGPAVPVTTVSLFNAGLSIAFRFDIPAYMNSLPGGNAVKGIFNAADGTRYYQIRVSDDPSKKGGTDPAVSTSGWETYSFTLDSLSPKIGFVYADPQSTPPPPGQPTKIA